MSTIFDLVQTSFIRGLGLYSHPEEEHEKKKKTMKKTKNYLNNLQQTEIEDRSGISDLHSIDVLCDVYISIILSCVEIKRILCRGHYKNLKINKIL
jgi:hypothetical protein